MKAILGFLVTALVTILFASIGLQAQNVVIDWNNIAATTIITNAKQSSTASGVWFAYVQLAVYDAVNATDHRHRPYLFTADAPASASKDAAAVAAAHRVLANYFPTQQASLDAQFASSLATISDTPANSAAGTAVGEQAAEALIAARFHDGLLANVPYTPPVGLGFYQRTPPAFAPPIAPWLGHMVPFTMTSATQFFPDEGPDALNSEVWIDYSNPVKTLGAP